MLTTATGGQAVNPGEQGASDGRSLQDAQLTAEECARLADNTALARGSPKPPPWSTSSLPTGTRLILRKERPHPGARLRFHRRRRHAGHCIHHQHRTRRLPGQVAGLELRHRQHARIEDRIRELKATGQRNLPCHAFWANAVWLEIVLAAADLVTRTRLLGFADQPQLAHIEIATFRYRVLHIAAASSAAPEQTRLRIDATWRWAEIITTTWHRIRPASG